MKKEDFLKIGIAEELAVKCEAASLGELKDYVPRSRMDEVNKENKSLKQTVSERDKQLADLEKTNGDNETLKNQLIELQKLNAEQLKAHEAEMSQLKLDNAVEAALTAAGAKNNKALRALLDSGKFKLDGSGKLEGLEEQLKAVRKSDPYLFTEKEQATASFKGFQPGASGDVSPGAGTDISRMTYSEMTAYLAQNPNAKIE